MRRVIALFACLGLFVTTIGCHTSSFRRSECPASRAPRAIHTQLDENQPTALTANTESVAPVSFEQTSSDESSSDPALQTPLDSEEELFLDQLIADVQSVHPSIAAMYSAWQAAAQRYPQAVALDDPMFGATLAPASIGSPDVESAYAFEASQKLPWHGKRALRGAAARASADSASRDIETTRQKLAEVTELAFWDYYVSQRLLELTSQNTEILLSFRDNAESRYQTGLVTQQDVLQADVELANLEQRRIELQRMEKVASGRINVLLRRSPADPLPRPSRPADRSMSLPDEHLLLDVAVSQRPEVSAAAARILEEQARLALACKQYYPDAELFGRYDTFWQPRDTQSDFQGQIGARINLPVYEARLNAAVCEARFRVAKARADYDQLVLEVQADVQAAYEQVIESQRTVELYSTKLVPVAEQNVDVARSNYDTARITFLELAITQRQLIDARERLLEAQVELLRRAASLRRVAGGSIPEGSEMQSDSEL